MGKTGDLFDILLLRRSFELWSFEVRALMSENGDVEGSKKTEMAVGVNVVGLS